MCMLEDQSITCRQHLPGKWVKQKHNLDTGKLVVGPFKIRWVQLHFDYPRTPSLEEAAHSQVRYGSTPLNFSPYPRTIINFQDINPPPVQSL
ncbi:hypothetical protein CY34DRAFT_255445 [Suillus luteus UH-Slu-Lm8-n1]|uniref:Uncharacterized protein n=1 Tax=Suillus luteus UH-Slu-Lm8-n1 TaxID=930992 RepID=A0A0D0ARI5_9AGAM|nr:hypothetical protein CY34DRAFT_255445 [Suillus luteus UH-Slu-Lm8-n1]